MEDVVTLSPDKKRPYDLKYPLVMVGDSAVGKTCLVVRFAEETFHPVFIATIGEWWTGGGGTSGQQGLKLDSCQTPVPLTIFRSNLKFD